MAVGRREAIAGLLLRLRAMNLPHELMAAFEAVPRQNFVPVMHLDASYGPGQLPIECGQIMGSADMIARVLRHLEVGKDHRVLEIGTGTGYQAAILGKMAAKVTSLERWHTLVDKARQRLKALELDNAVVELADGRDGRPGEMFDRIVSNCAFDDIPRHFLDQLAAGGMAIAPVGPADGQQVMRKMVKVGARFEVHDLHNVRQLPFVPGVALAV